MCHDTHAGTTRQKRPRHQEGAPEYSPCEDYKKVEEHRARSQPTKSLQCSNLADQTSCNGANNNAYDEAQIAFRQLADGLATAQDDQGNVEEKLERLQHVASVSEPRAVDAEGNITISLHRVAVAVELKKHAPELITRIASKRSEDCEERHARP